MAATLVELAARSPMPLHRIEEVEAAGNLRAPSRRLMELGFDYPEGMKRRERGRYLDAMQELRRRLDDLLGGADR